MADDKGKGVRKRIELDEKRVESLFEGKEMMCEPESDFDLTSSRRCWET
jgi:hypothetical protein